MEKVENLYRTARAQNVSINTSEQIRSRLRESRRAVRRREACQLMILNRWSAGSVRCAREYNRNAITVAAGMCGWIFSYAACRVRARSSQSFAAGRPVRGRCSEQSVQMRPVDRAGGEATAMARNESFRHGIFPNIARIRRPPLLAL